MEIKELFKKLNSFNNGKFQYQNMSTEEIVKLLTECNCPVAIGLGQKVSLVKGVVDPTMEKESIVFQCNYAVKGEENIIFTEMNCKIPKIGRCTQHCPNGDFEPGLGIFINPKS